MDSAIARSGRPEPPGPRRLSHRPADADRRCGRPLVLVAEDDDDMRRLLVRALRNEGFRVRGVRNGVELLNRIGALMLEGRLEAEVDLIVSDVRMPGITGIKVLAGLRRAGARVPLILITAFGDERLHAEARSLGAPVLDKPFDLDELVALARAQVRSAQ